MSRATINELATKLKKAQTKIKKGDRYAHHTSQDKLYEVVDIALLEATEEPCVIYTSLYAPHLTWIRSVEHFLEDVGNGPRFRKV